MTVRFTVERAAIVRIHVAGRLTREAIGELEEMIGDDPRAVSLELHDLRSADAAGLAALRWLRSEGVELRGVPPHLAWRIEDAP